MGHIIAHAKISDHIIQQLQPMTADANLIYLKLGNFITDISQFRDPYAFISAKQRLPLVAQFGFATKWKNDLLGKPPDRRYAALAEFFLHICRFASHIFFAEDSPFKLYFAHSTNAHGLPLKEVNRVFDCAFTQYYPHEHLDLPPFIEGPRQRQHPFYQANSRGMMRYLEEQLRFVSEELSKIEGEWIRKRSLPFTDPQICDLLVRLGHILHAVEDYFFHSNFVEVWKRHNLQLLHPRHKPYDNRQDYNFLLDHLLTLNPQDTSAAALGVLLKRRFARRLRYPIFTRGTQGDPQQSEDATQFVYTGGFGANDVFHTITCALEALEEIMEKAAMHLPPFAEELRKLRESDLVLVRALFNQAERQVLATQDNIRDKRLEEHRKQVLTGEYRRRIHTKRESGFFTGEAEAALLRAFEVDEAFMRSHPLAFGKNFPGVGEFLIYFLADAQRENLKSDAAVEILNKQPESIYSFGTENGASEETIGTHSLMSKDSAKKSKDGTSKQVLRDEAMALAKFVSATLAILMVRRVQQNPNPEQGYDWEIIVRHFVRFPQNRHSMTGTWEGEVLDAAATGGQLPMLENIKDKPPLVVLTTNDPSNRLQNLRRGTTIQQLEKLYKQMEYRSQ